MYMYDYFFLYSIVVLEKLCETILHDMFFVKSIHSLYGYTLTYFPLRLFNVLKMFKSFEEKHDAQFTA